MRGQTKHQRQFRLFPEGLGIRTAKHFSLRLPALLLVFLLGSACCFIAPSPPATILETAPDFRQLHLITESLPQYDALFYRETGWTGGDAMVSVALSENLTLWLYGDTLFSDIRSGRRVCPWCMVRNSIALQRGKEPATASIEFFFGPQSNGKPTAFFTPPDGRGWLWPGDGIRTQKGLYLFFQQLERDPDPRYLFGKDIGSWLIHIPNPGEAPARWNISYFPLPWSSGTPSGDTPPAYGRALLKDKGFIYIYGFDEKMQDGMPMRFMTLARAPEDYLADFDRWRFYDDGQWEADVTRAGRGFPIAPEYSVSYQPVLEEYVAIYTEHGLSRKILLRRSPAPYGPWSEPTVVYTCREMDRNPRILCYAARGHMNLATAPDELIVTYAVNSLDSVEDARLYFPRFLRAKLAR